MLVPDNMHEQFSQRCSLEQYFEFARESEVKLEYVNDTAVAMPGANYHHCLIGANTLAELGNRLKRTRCHVLDSNMRVGVIAARRYTYPDGSVVCGEPQFDPRDSETIVNPRVLIEVLSPSTERSDRGEKFTRYRMLESLQEYVLVAQDKPQVETFYRQGDGGWLLMPYAGLEAIVNLRSLEIEIPSAEIYAGVTFPLEEEPKPIPGEIHCESLPK